MKSNPNSEKCKECYERLKKYPATLLPCEATGHCKNENLPSAEHHKLNIAEYIHDQYPDVWRHAEKELEVPSAERKGHWIEKEDPYGFFNSIPVCSECGCTTKMRERYNFCPNCGASMVRGEEDV